MSAAKLVTVYGGSGFLGRQVSRLLAAEGYRVRVAVRRPNEAGVVRTYGAPGQVEPVFCNIRDDSSVRAAMIGADAVVNCAGIMVRQGRNTFNAVHVDAAGRIARISAGMDVAHLVHVSALGADPKAASAYAASKGQGEAAVLQHRPDAVILRPAVLFGSDDTFYNRLASMSRFGPALLVPGANTRMQPVYVLDVAEVARRAAQGQVEAGIYELAGPEILTMRQIAQQVLRKLERRRLVIGVPLWIAGIGGVALDMVQAITGGLLTNKILTRDQTVMLRQDNRASGTAKGFADLAITPTSAEAVIGDYLWRFRPAGQYDAITDSASQLRRS